MPSRVKSGLLLGVTTIAFMTTINRAYIKNSE